MPQRNRRRLRGLLFSSGRCSSPNRRRLREFLFRSGRCSSRNRHGTILGMRLPTTLKTHHPTIIHMCLHDSIVFGILAHPFSCLMGTYVPLIVVSTDPLILVSSDPLILVSTDPLILVSRFWHKVPRTFFLLANWRNLLDNFWTPTRHLAFADGSCLLSIGPQLGPSCCSRESNSCFFHAYKNNHNNHTSPTIIHGSLDPCIHGSLYPRIP